MLPVKFTGHGIEAYTWMPLLALGVFLSVQWWAAWYPGAEPGGGGYVAQRIFSAKTERDGVLATLFFNVAHYAIRPWPWIITGLCTVLLYPAGIGPTHDHEAAYVQAFVDLLPTPWRGFMMAGFAAAYMSTVGTQLNWGASYLVNDFYKRFLNRTATEKHYVAISRWATIGLFLASAVVAWQLDSVKGAWKFLLALGSGTGLVLILRWYWWRINAWSEISAMIVSAMVSLSAHPFIVARYPTPDDPRVVAVTMLVTIITTTIVWVAVTYMTGPEPDATLDAFYLRVRPGGPGWAHVSKRLGRPREDSGRRAGLDELDRRHRRGVFHAVRDREVDLWRVRDGGCLLLVVAWGRSPGSPGRSGMRKGRRLTSGPSRIGRQWRPTKVSSPLNGNPPPH